MVIERLLLAAAEGAGRDHVSFRRIFTQEHKRRLYTPEFLQSVDGFDPLAEYAGCLDQVQPEDQSLGSMATAPTGPLPPGHP